MTVNGHEVSEKEFRWYMEQERAEVFSYFRNRHGLDGGKGFWTQGVEGITPRAMLRSNAVARVVREKVEQIQFQELGLLQDIRYTAFLAQLGRFNQEREQAVKLGRTVYGPVRYTPMQFYEHRKASLRMQARETLAEVRWPPGEEILKKFYNKNRDLFQALPLFSLEVVTLQPRGNLTGKQADAVKSAAQTILSRFNAGRSLVDVVRELPEDNKVEISGRRLKDINLDRLTELFAREEELKSVLALTPGDAVLLRGSTAEAKVVKCLARIEGGVRPYDAVRRRVRELWAAERYDQHLEHLVGQAEVKVSQQVLESLLP